MNYKYNEQDLKYGKSGAVLIYHIKNELQNAKDAIIDENGTRWVHITIASILKEFPGFSRERVQMKLALLCRQNCLYRKKISKRHGYYYAVREQKNNNAQLKILTTSSSSKTQNDNKHIDTIVAYLKERLSKPYFNIVDEGHTYIYATRKAIKAFCPNSSINTIGKYLKILSSEKGILTRKKFNNSGGYWYAFKNIKIHHKNL